MTALILQARIDSTRLPGKALLPLDGKPLLSRVMEALLPVEADMRILACPEDCVRDFQPLAEETGFVLSVGPKEDVLTRYCIAIRRFSIDRVIRATGDNPFVFADAASKINAEGMELDADYAAFAALPHGAGVESVSARALLQAEKEAHSPADREHVCPWLYTHSEWFTLHRPLAPPPWRGPSLRITVDTPEDFHRAEILHAALNRTGVGGARYQGAAILRACREIESGRG